MAKFEGADAFVWEEMPVHGALNPRWREIAQQLKHNPGRSARVDLTVGSNRATTRATSLRRLLLRFDPDGEWEVRTHQLVDERGVPQPIGDNTHGVWARYIGAAADRPSS